MRSPVFQIVLNHVGSQALAYSVLLRNCIWLPPPRRGRFSPFEKGTIIITAVVEDIWLSVIHKSCNLQSVRMNFFKSESQKLSLSLSVPNENTPGPCPSWDSSSVSSVLSPQRRSATPNTFFSSRPCCLKQVCELKTTTEL